MVASQHRFAALVDRFDTLDVAAVFGTLRLAVVAFMPIAIANVIVP
jgi:hypothetical protein